MAANPMRKLAFLVGTWDTTGATRATGAAAAQALRATDAYEWMPGGFFLIHHADALIGHQRSHVMEVFGYDPAMQSIVSRSFDDQGKSEGFIIGLKGRRWTIRGDDARFEGDVGKDFSVIEGTWELRGDDGGWAPWMDIRLAKRAA